MGYSSDHAPAHGGGRPGPGPINNTMVDPEVQSRIVTPLFVRCNQNYDIKYTSYTHYHSNFEAGGCSQPSIIDIRVENPSVGVVLNSAGDVWPNGRCIQTSQNDPDSGSKYIPHKKRGVGRHFIEKRGEGEHDIMSSSFLQWSMGPVGPTSSFTPIIVPPLRSSPRTTMIARRYFERSSPQ